jgi:hypothetical protein
MLGWIFSTLLFKDILCSKIDDTEADYSIEFVRKSETVSSLSRREKRTYFKNMSMIYKPAIHGFEIDEHIRIFQQNISECPDLECVNKIYLENQQNDWVPDKFKYYKDINIYDADKNPMGKKTIYGLTRDDLEAAIKDKEIFEERVAKLSVVTEESLNLLKSQLFSKKSKQTKSKAVSYRQKNKTLASAIAAMNIKETVNILENLCHQNRYDHMQADSESVDGPKILSGSSCLIEKNFLIYKNIKFIFSESNEMIIDMSDFQDLIHQYPELDDLVEQYENLRGKVDWLPEKFQFIDQSLSSQSSLFQVAGLIHDGNLSLAVKDKKEFEKRWNTSMLIQSLVVTRIARLENGNTMKQ